MNWVGLCNVEEKFIFAIGGRLSGWSQYCEPQKSVECHELAKNTWTEIPDLNVPRAGLSSCYLEEYIYAFCGMKENRQRLSSLERLRIVTVSPRLNTVPEWELIEPRDKTFVPRSNPVVLAWNLTSIAILGGIG